MAHDVFISYATAQRSLAFQLTEQFEANQVRCWVAPRDIVSGTVWVDAIMTAIDSSRLVLVLLSAEANKSPQVKREVNHAVDHGIPILPVRTENVPLHPRLWYILSDTHFHDAFDRPASRRYDELTSTVRILLSGGAVAEEATTSDEPKALSIRPPDEGVAAVDLDSLQVAVDPAAEPPPEQIGQYAARMNSQRPGCFILMVDQSGSMNRKIAGTEIRKRQAVADAVNSLLYEAVLRATGDDGVRHRFDIGVLGYGADQQGVQSAFGKDLVPITEIAALAEQPQKRLVHRPDGRGGVLQQTVELPIWFEPVVGKGKTLMYAAFERTLAAAKAWTRDHQASFPPIVINITDGGFTEKDPTPLVYEIQELCTQAGNALIFNCHVSETEGGVVTYPGPTRAVRFEKRVRQLYEMSSVLPELMRERARELGYDIEPEARGYVLNADAATLIDFLDIGGTRAMAI
jgi:Mg-chelatase subunit ChlD